MRDIVKGINFLIKMMFYGVIAEIFANGLYAILKRKDVKEMIARTKAKINGTENDTEKKEPEARKIGFVCEK